MKKSLLFLAFTLLFIQPVLAADPALEISNGWVKPTLGGKDLTAAFFDVKNTGTKARVLKALSSDTGTAEMHNTIEEKGIMKMRHLDAVEIKPGETVSFKPRAKHIMLTNLKAPLKEGDKVKFTFQFDGGEEISQIFPVTAPKMEAAPQEEHHHH